MKSTKEISFGAGQIYTVVPYPTSYGLSVLSDIFTLFGEPLAQLAISAKDVKSITDFDIKPEQITSIMMSLTAKVQPDTLDALFKKILINTNVDKGSQSVTSDYDERFAGEYALLFKLVWKTLEVQYGDFLGKLAALRKPLAAAQQ